MAELSVLIATYNRADTLARCLGALNSQSAETGRFEVVVVDDGSRDETSQLLAGFESRYPLRFERQDNRGQPAALNRALRLASAPCCLFLDDDILADPGLIAAHLEGQAAGPAIGLGHLRLRVPAHAGALVRHFERRWRIHYDRLEADPASATFWDCYSGNLSAPADVLRAVGGFDQTLARSFDVELGFRLQNAGLEIRYLGTASAEQAYAKGFADVVGDFDAAGRASISMWKRHPELARFPPLGDFSQTARRSLALRRLLLALRAPVWPLRLVDPVLRRRPPESLYMFLQFYCFWRSVREALDDGDTWRRLTRPPLVLMYHAIGGRGERGSRYVIPRRRLALQLAWMRLLRYRVMTMARLVEDHEAGRLTPPRAVVLTFDDGYVDNLTLGLPLLRRSGFQAAFYVVAGCAGDANRWTPDGPLHNRPLLSWSGVRELEAAGMEVGSHSITHPDLTELSEQEATREMADSRERIARELERPVEHFAFPYGKTSPSLQLAAAEVGYRSALGITAGLNGLAVSRHDIRRLEVHGDRGFFAFVLALWLGTPVRA